MNTVPLLFAESVGQFFDVESVCSLKDYELSFNDCTSCVFGNVGRLLNEKRIYIDLHVVFNSEAGNFDYSVDCLRYPGSDTFNLHVPYTFNPADYRFVRKFEVNLFKEKSDARSKAPWTTASPSDPTFLKWLRAPFARTKLLLSDNCPEFMKLLPDYCTFNEIHAYSVYSEAVDAIIQRSQDCGRLERVSCNEFFQKRPREEAADWISTNDRLKQISFRDIKTNIDDVVALFGDE